MRQPLFVIVLTAALAACTKEATAPTLATRRPRARRRDLLPAAPGPSPPVSWGRTRDRPRARGLSRGPPRCRGYDTAPQRSGAPVRRSARGVLDSSGDTGAGGHPLVRCRGSGPPWVDRLRPDGEASPRRREGPGTRDARPVSAVPPRGGGGGLNQRLKLRGGDCRWGCGGLG